MQIKNLLGKDASIVILTGAGISAESGLDTFRGAGGLWCGHRVEDVATPQAFARDPELVHEFYNMRRTGLLDPKIQPNPAHNALAELEGNWPGKNGGEVLVVTQNIDDLHERAGTKNLLHMHGEVLKAFCEHCRQTGGYSNETVDKIYIMQYEGNRDKTSTQTVEPDTQPMETDTQVHIIELCKSNLGVEDICPVCEKTGGIRPDIVWFGEMPYHMNEIFEALQNCSLFLSIGTSGNVYPAAGFVSEALHSGAVTAEFNLEPANNASVFHEQIYGPAGTTVPQLVEELLS